MTTKSLATTSNQTTLDSPKFNINPTSLGIMPVKLLPERANVSVERKMTKQA
jgi:hypothetical protein